MGILDFVKGGVKELAIARPDEAKDHWVYKHPDQTIPWKAQLTVRADELAMFFKKGVFVGLLPPGQHTLDGNNIPFLGQLIDKFTGGNVFISEVYFVSTREHASIKFGTQVGNLSDPETEMRVKLMVHGEFSAKVVDPQKLVIGFVGLGIQGNDAFLGWFKSLVQKEIKDQIAELVVKQKWPVLDVSSGAYTNEISDTTIAALRAPFDKYGVQVESFGDFSITMDPADIERFDKLKDRTAYVRAAGREQQHLAAAQQMAQMDMMTGAAEGMKKGGGTGLEGAGIGMGFAMAGQMANVMNNSQARPAAAPVAAPVAAVAAPADIMATLKQLGELKAAGILTDAEFDAKKKELLAKL